MFTHENKVETYMEHVYCDICNTEFELVPEDPCKPIIDIAVWPPRPNTYEYYCPACGNTMHSEILYPRIVYKEVTV